MNVNIEIVKIDLDLNLIKSFVVKVVKIKNRYMLKETETEKNRLIYVYTLSDPNTSEIRYVGITYNVRRRYNEHLRFSKFKNTHVYTWIRSLKDKPKVDIIDTCRVGDFPVLEKYYITLYREMGHNLTNHTLGGEGTYGMKMSDEFKIKKSLSMKGELNQFFGKKHTDEVKKILSEVDRSGINNSMYNKKHKSDSKKKMSIKKNGIFNGEKNPRAKKIYQYELDGKTLIKEWNFAKDCSDVYGMSRGNLSSTSKYNTNKDIFSLNLPYRVVYGYIFKFH